MAWTIDYSVRFRPTPFSRWVHKPVHKRSADSQRAFKAETDRFVVEFEPPVSVVFGKGYPLIIVTLGAEEVRFASLDEMRFVINALRAGNIDKQPWHEDLPKKAFDADHLPLTLSALAAAYTDIKGAGEIG